MRIGLRPSHALCGFALLVGVLLSDSANAANVYGKVSGAKNSVNIALNSPNKVYNIKTNSNGEYSVFLPAGNYSFKVVVGEESCTGQIKSYDFPARQDIKCP